MISPAASDRRYRIEFADRCRAAVRGHNVRVPATLTRWLKHDRGIRRIPRCGRLHEEMPLPGR
jgi:hypothetical protein